MLKDQWSFYAAGVKHHELFRCIDEVVAGDQLFMVPEPTNQFDPNAIKLEFFSPVHDEQIMVGYVPAKWSAEISAFLETADDPICLVKEVTPSAKPWQQLKVQVVDLPTIEEIEQDG